MTVTEGGLQRKPRLVRMNERLEERKRKEKNAIVSSAYQNAISTDENERAENHILEMKTRNGVTSETRLMPDPIRSENRIKAP